MSASTSTISGRAPIESVVSNRWVSSLSSRMRRAGSESATCRAISEPIEPPAPVMSTRLPASSRRTASRSVTTSRRPRRSSISRSRTSRIDTPSPTVFANPGTIRSATPAASEALAVWRTSSFVTELIARTAWCARWRFATAGRSSIPPSMRRPMNDRPWRRTSSSRTATGTRPARGLRSMSRTRAAPASPEPITTTRRPDVVSPVPRRKENSLAWNRTAPIPAMAARGPKTSIETGMRSSPAITEAATSSTIVVRPAQTSRFASWTLAWRQNMP